MNMNFGYVVAVEELMDLKVPQRVEYIRVIMAELNRIASHLLALGVRAFELVDLAHGQLALLVVREFGELSSVFLVEQHGCQQVGLLGLVHGFEHMLGHDGLLAVVCADRVCFSS